MKLLLDQNISYRLLSELSALFSGSHHVRLLGLEKATDEEIWNYAKKNGFVIVTQDSDFYERSLLFGFPPKVIWLRVGNTNTEYIKKILVNYKQTIMAFMTHKTLGCLEIY